MWIFRGGARLPANDVRIFYAKEGIVHVYESDEIEKNYAAFKQSVDPEERDRLMTAVGDEIFEEYARIPIAWFFFDVAVDPKRVAAYDFPGTITGIITHLDSVKAAR
jgi:ABC-type transport system substrate-binding protein